MSTETAESSLGLSRLQWDREMVARIGLTSALLGAAAVHSTVMEHHYAAWAVAGSFFLVLQITQTVLAVAVVLFWRPATALAVVLVSMGAVAVWLASRTVGVPFGPEGFVRPEAIGPADLACCTLELAAAAMAAPWALRGSALWHRLRSSGGGARAPLTPHRAVGAAALIVLGSVAVTVFGLLPGLTAEEHTRVDHGVHAHTGTGQGGQAFSP